jgi:hypothetical protein
MIKKALLIGINYTGTEDELTGCINDAKNMRKLLIDVYGYKPENILLLTDFTEYPATRNNILAAMPWLLSIEPAAAFDGNIKTQNNFLPAPQLQAVFFFSGHGVQVRAKEGNEVDRKDEALCPIDYKIKGVITDNTIRAELVVKINEQSSLFGIIDACHSGSVFDLLWRAGTDRRGSLKLETEGRYKETVGNVIMLSAAEDSQKAADVLENTARYGLLTNVFLEELQAGSYNVSYKELIRGVNNRLNKRSDITSQNAVLSFGKDVSLEDVFNL